MCVGDGKEGKWLRGEEEFWEVGGKQVRGRVKAGREKDERSSREGKQNEDKGKGKLRGG